MNGLDPCRSRATMPLYRLTPISPNDPNWQTSIHRQVAVIRADSEEQARSLASQAFNTTLAPSSPGRKMATPRWHRSDAVRAEIIQDPRYGSEGRPAFLSHGVTPDTIGCRTMGGRAVSGAREQGDRARVAAFRIDRHPFADALEGEVDPGLAHRQTPDRETVDAD